MSSSAPRPQALVVQVSSTSISPLAPRSTSTPPAGDWAANGIQTSWHFLRAASTSGRRTTWAKWGEPISSSPSATRTMLTGGLRPAARSACSAARKVASGPFWFTAPRPIITLP